jgi:hypothetical protein
MRGAYSGGICRQQDIAAFNVAGPDSLYDKGLYDKGRTLAIAVWNYPALPVSAFTPS